MNPHPDQAILETVLGALKRDQFLSSFVGIDNISDYFKDDAGYPRVRIGAVRTSDYSSHTHTGFRGTLTVETYTQQRGRWQCQRIMDGIYQIINNSDNLDLKFYYFLDIRLSDNAIMDEGDGITRNGIQSFDFILGVK